MLKISSSKLFPSINSYSAFRFKPLSAPKNLVRSVALFQNTWSGPTRLTLFRSVSIQSSPPPNVSPSLPSRPKFFLQKGIPDILNIQEEEIRENGEEKNKKSLQERVITLSQQNKLEEAVQLVLESRIDDQSEVSWNQLIAECVDKGRVKLGVRLLNEMKRFSLQPSQNTYTLLLNGLAEYRALPDNILHARAIIDSIRRASRTKSTFKLTVGHANALLKVCFRTNEFQALLNNYDALFYQGGTALIPNKETYTIVLSACAKNCRKYSDQAYELAMSIWESVYEKAMTSVRKPARRAAEQEDAIDDDLVCSVLLTFRNSGEIEKGFEVIKDIYGIGDDIVRTRPYNIQMTSKSLDIMIGLCFKSQQYKLGIKLFNEAKVRFPDLRPDIQNFNSLISLYNESGQCDEAIGIFKQVLDLELQPIDMTFDLLMISCKNAKNLDAVKEIFGIIIKHKVIPKTTALTKILEMTMESDPDVLTREVRWILNKIDQIGLKDPLSLVKTATMRGISKLPFEIDDVVFLRTIINAYGVALDKSGGKLPDHTEERWKNNLKFYKNRLWDLNQKQAQIEQFRMQKERMRSLKNGSEYKHQDVKYTHQQTEYESGHNRKEDVKSRSLSSVEKKGKNWLDDDETIIIDDSRDREISKLSTRRGGFSDDNDYRVKGSDDSRRPTFSRNYDNYRGLGSFGSQRLGSSRDDRFEDEKRMNQKQFFKDEDFSSRSSNRHVSLTRDSRGGFRDERVREPLQSPGARLSREYRGIPVVNPRDGFKNERRFETSYRRPRDNNLRISAEDCSDHNPNDEERDEIRESRNRRDSREFDRGVSVSRVIIIEIGRKVKRMEKQNEKEYFGTQESFMSVDGTVPSVTTETTEEGNNENPEGESMITKPPPKKRKRNMKPKAEDSESKKPKNKTGPPKPRAPKKQSKEQEPSESNSLVSTAEFATSTNTGPWKHEDDQLLIDLVLSHLMEVPWAKLAKNHFPLRSRQGLVGRWSSLKKKIRNINFDGEVADMDETKNK
ncbi:9374_t:CDS:2 [Acaulospora colombiana]|uniref:9374_t:CDS:1 n=1 Tax=Acaulospora colombiana TaxID=27376 RepID=A0ACA9L1P6_9GLOM|nr:9374_t:CDS:2 [Acaulospora colombiana]